MPQSRGTDHWFAYLACFQSAWSAISFDKLPFQVLTISLETSVAGNTMHSVIHDGLIVSSGSNLLLSIGRALDDEFVFKWEFKAHRLTN